MKRKTIIILFIIVILLTYAILVTYQFSRYNDAYNCLNYTIESLDYLNEHGIKAYQVSGTDRWNGDIHCWVGIDFFGHILHFEPICLIFFYPDVRYEYITVKYG